jgi:16S rRNA (uracil1498-N3)-methyltransferase
MRITRVYADLDLSQALQREQGLRLSGMASAHLIKVLRLRAGADVVLFNGDGFDYRARIVVPKVEAAEVEVLDRSAVALESPLRITLIQALCRGEKMDWVLEKATEAGVSAIIPVQSERTEVQLDAERAGKRREHWLRVVLSACEQSGRAVVPNVENLQSLEARLAQGVELPLKLVLEPGSSSLRQVLQVARSVSSAIDQQIAIAVGPEGGFSERDLKQLEIAGFVRVSLGPRVLRTETAGLAAIAALQALQGDF